MPMLKGSRKPNRIPLDTRFWAKVNKDGPIPVHAPELGPCWLWTSSRNNKGYGEIHTGSLSQNMLAHRAAWLLETGAMPTLNVLHRCDGGPIGCVRFSHLFQGTKADNTRDMMEKGRGMIGSRQPTAKLTEAAVTAIRAAYAGGARQREIAAQYGVSQPIISEIVTRRKWKHV